jgi:hypothetical protein
MIQASPLSFPTERSIPMRREERESSHRKDKTRKDRMDSRSPSASGMTLVKILGKTQDMNTPAMDLS